MPATCGICKHAERAAIEQAHVDGLSLRAIAKAHPGTTPWSLRRHFAHVPAIIAKVTEHQVAQNIATAKLPARVEKLIAEAEAITMTARRKRDFSAALAAIRTRLSCLEMIGKLSGELRPGGPGEFIPANIQVNVGEQAKPKMTHEHFMEHIRNIYGLPPRKPPTDKIM